MIRKSKKIVEPSLYVAFFATKTNAYAKKALVEDVAPFSAIGKTELFVCCRRSLAGDVVLCKIPDVLSHCEYWPYRNDLHASEGGKILGSARFHLRTGHKAAVSIRHLVVEGTFQWVLGQNLTKN